MANVLKEELRRRQRSGIHLPGDEEPRGYGYGRGPRRSMWGERSDWQDESDEESENRPRWTYYEEDWFMPGPYTGMGPMGYHRSDERIHDDIVSRLTRHGRVDASDIQIQVNNGQVTLQGNVDNRQAKRMIEDTVEGVSGVTDVHNQLRIREGSEAQTRSRGFFW